MIKNVLIALALIAGVSALVLTLTNKKPEMFYIEMGKVYEEFNLSKELNKELEDVIKSRKTITDSIYEQLRVKTQDLKYQQKKTMLEVQKLAKYEEEYYYKQQEFEKENQLTVSDYNSKIWKQLNQYISDFGEEKKCEFIFGANGQGSIMFGSKGKNITEEIIKYVNDKYNGKAK